MEDNILKETIVIEGITKEYLPKIIELLKGLTHAEAKELLELTRCYINNIGNDLVL